MLALLISLTAAWDNGLALTPPMGWCTWNYYHRGFSEEVFHQATDAMASHGMRELGYEYINVDGGWWEGADTGTVVRNATGYPTWNTKKFPSGLPALVKYINSKGFKYGHYTDAGKYACNKDAPMSEGYEFKDAALFAEWGAEMLKVDACGDAENHTVIVQRWRAAIEATKRPILLSNCHNGCETRDGDGWLPDNACPLNANMWRSSKDIGATWRSFLHNLDSLKGRGSFGAPGGWNDPDFLEINIGEFELTGTESESEADDILEKNRAHFAAWAVTSAPLILGFKWPAPDAIMEVVKNKLAIRVNQEYASNAGDFVRRKGEMDLWAKPLLGGETAAVVLNRGTNVTGLLSYSLDELPGIQKGVTQCTGTEVWSGAAKKVGPTVTASPGAHAAAFMVFSECA